MWVDSPGQLALECDVGLGSPLAQGLDLGLEGGELLGVVRRVGGVLVLVRPHQVPDELLLALHAVVEGQGHFPGRLGHPRLVLDDLEGAFPLVADLGLLGGELGDPLVGGGKLRADSRELSLRTGEVATCGGDLTAEVPGRGKVAIGVPSPRVRRLVEVDRKTRRGEEDDADGGGRCRQRALVRTEWAWGWARVGVSGAGGEGLRRRRVARPCRPGGRPVPDRLLRVPRELCDGLPGVVRVGVRRVGRLSVLLLGGGGGKALGGLVRERVAGGATGSGAGVAVRIARGSAGAPGS